MTKKNFHCSAPWEGMFINPDGEFRICCAGKSLGNLNKSSLTDVINGEELNKVKEDMLTQGYSDYCTTCIGAEEKTGRSMRDHFNKDLSTVDTANFKPRSIDIRWRNTCQLRCSYCFVEWSSAYARWAGKVQKASATNWQRQVLDYISENKDNIEFTNLLGGEPLLLKENIELLDYINPERHIGVTTNLSVKGVENLPMHQKLLNRKTNWLISLEAVGNKFEYIRRNAKWEITKSNYENLSINDESTKGCHMTYCILSAFSLVEVFDWLYEVDSRPGHNHTFLSILLGPDEFSVYSFPAEIKKLAIAELDRLLEKHEKFLNTVSINFVTTTKQTLLDTLDDWSPKAVKDFIEYIDKSEIEMAPISFKEEWPDVYAILERYRQLV